MKTVLIELPETLFSALRKPPNEFVKEMRIAAAVKWYELEQLPQVNWGQKIEEITITPEVAGWDLGKGEAEVLSFTFNNPTYAAIVDDRAAKNCAKALGIITLGTGGVLLLAKRRGLIPNISPRLEALRNSGLWLSDTVINLLKQQAGE